MAKPIGTLGVIDTLTIGGRVYTDLTNLIILHGAVSISGNPTTFRKANGTAGYQAVNTLTISSVVFHCVTASAGVVGNLGYTDTDYGINNGGGVTGAFKYIADSATLPQIPFDSTTGNTTITSNINFTVATTKYLFFVPGSSINTIVLAYGYDA